MNSKDLQPAYIERLNLILPAIDLDKLDRSCNSADNRYAKKVLRQMHNAFVDVYGKQTVSIARTMGLSIFLPS